MKRILLAFLISLLPLVAFADVQLGGVAIYDHDIFSLGNTSLSLSDFQFGGEARLGLGVFQLSAYAFYLSGQDFTTIGIYPDIGLSFKIASFLRLGVAAGPNLTLVLGNGAPQVSAIQYVSIPASDNTATLIGGNLKFSADLVFGALSFGIVGYYIMQTVTDLTEQSLTKLFSGVPAIGVTVLLNLN